jgi:hypothetical protein
MNESEQTKTKSILKTESERAGVMKRSLPARLAFARDFHCGSRIVRRWRRPRHCHCCARPNAIVIARSRSVSGHCIGDPSGAVVSGGRRQAGCIDRVSVNQLDRGVAHCHRLHPPHKNRCECFAVTCLCTTRPFLFPPSLVPPIHQ